MQRDHGKGGGMHFTGLEAEIIMKIAIQNRKESNNATRFKRQKAINKSGGANEKKRDSAICRRVGRV